MSEDETESEQDENQEGCEFITMNKPKQYDDNNKMFTFSGRTGPYFKNYTHFLLFMWITKHQIGIVYKTKTLFIILVILI